MINTTIRRSGPCAAPDLHRRFNRPFDRPHSSCALTMITAIAQFLWDCGSVSRALTRSFHDRTRSPQHSKNIRVQVWNCEPSTSHRFSNALSFSLRESRSCEASKRREARTPGRPAPPTPLSFSRCNDEPAIPDHRSLPFASIPVGYQPRFSQLRLCRLGL